MFGLSAERTAEIRHQLEVEQRLEAWIEQMENDREKEADLAWSGRVDSMIDRHGVGYGIRYATLCARTDRAAYRWLEEICVRLHP